MKELRIEADVGKLQEVVDFVRAQLEGTGCSDKELMEIRIAVEEIFVNIASYAYVPGKGLAVIQVELIRKGADGSLELTFMDNGKPFNPLDKKDPDQTFVADETKIGGLGIFMTKKYMDDVRYDYREGMNILSLKKKLCEVCR